MKTWSPRRKLALTVLAVALVVAALAAAAPVFAAPGTAAPPLAQTSQVERDVIVKFGDPVNVGVDERVQTVVSIGGDVTVAGTVTQSIVTVAGDVTLLSTARVGEATSAGDASVVVINGTLTQRLGVQLKGNVERVEIGKLGDVVDWLSRVPSSPSFNLIGSFVGWLVGTVIFLLLGLLAAAVMPGQLRAVERQVATRPGGSLGWGALTFFVIVPVSLVVLAITIVGLIPAVGVAVVLPFFTIFVVTAVATFVVERLFSAQLKGNLMLAVAIAVVATRLVLRIPVFGALLLLAMIVVGTGAAVLAWGASRRERKLLRNGGAPGGAPSGGTPAVPPFGAPPSAAQPPVAAQPPYGAPPSAAQPPVAAQPPYGAPPYPDQPSFAAHLPVVAQPPLAAHGAPPPYMQVPVGTQAYLHPQYGWLIYGPLPETQPPQGWAPMGRPADGLRASEPAVTDEGDEPGADEGDEPVAASEATEPAAADEVADVLEDRASEAEPRGETE